MNNFVHNPQSVIVFGGTGLVGLPVVKKALALGYKVTLFTRDKAKITFSHPQLSILEGDIQNEKDLLSALEHKDAVIQCIGIGGKGNGQLTTVVSTANKLIMRAMQQVDIKRYIVMSVIGAGDSWNVLPWIYRKCILPWIQRWFIPIIEDKNRLENDVRTSGLEWILVRATTVKNTRAKGSYKAITNSKGVSFSITADDLASFIVDQLATPSYIYKAPIVCN